MARALPLAFVLLAACSSPPPGKTDFGYTDPPLVDINALRGLNQMFHEYAAALVRADSTNPRDAELALLDLERLHPYCIFPDERERVVDGKKIPGLIDEARKNPDTRRELSRRGRIYAAVQAFWGKFDREAWNRARLDIAGLSINHDGEIYLASVFCMMLINGQSRTLWPEIRFQLVEIGKPAIPVVAGVAAAKADTTPDTVIYSEDDLVQIISVLINFGDLRFEEGENPKSGMEYARALAKHPRRNVRKAVARAIGEVKADFLLPELSELLREKTSTDSWMVRASAAEALEKFDGARARVAPILEEALRTETSSTVVVRILRAMGACHHPDLVPTLMKVIDSPNYDWSQEAMSALYHITGEKGLVTPPRWHDWYKTTYPAWKAHQK